MSGPAREGIFRVWDRMNAEEEDAREIIAAGPDDAAVTYASEDFDGWTDGLYQRCSQPICVRDCHGIVHRFDVIAEMVPEFRASKADP